jgi:hypothetical protein
MIVVPWLARESMQMRLLYACRLRGRLKRC